jgi:hypothetical protein
MKACLSYEKKNKGSINPPHYAGLKKDDLFVIKELLIAKISTVVVKFTA